MQDTILTWDTTTPIPSPWWLLTALKIFGFTLHMMAMNLWLIGLPLALSLRRFGCDHGKRFGKRLGMQMPIVVALGVNFGIVPLLFFQLGYAKAFYSATILMAWSWLSIVVLMIFAYYGVYLNAFRCREGDTPTPDLLDGDDLSDVKSERGTGEKIIVATYEKLRPIMRRWGGPIGSIMLIAVGTIFAAGMTLIESPGRWTEIWLGTSTHGAATGTFMPHGNPVVWARFLLMVGLAMLTTGAWTAIDAAWFKGDRPDSYQTWAGRMTRWLSVGGALIFWAVGAWYIFGLWTPEARAEILSGGSLIAILASAALPLAVIILSFVGGDLVGKSRSWATGIYVAQFALIGSYAISRQLLQNYNLTGVADIFGETNTQWSPLILFLLCFVFALAVVFWMLKIVVGSKPTVEEVG